jgi:hypothetical protein
VGTPSKKQRKKLIEKKCYFCDENDYSLLDVHRILEGKDGGKYVDHNMVVTCCKCHRKIHAGRIEIHGRYYSTAGKHVLHYTEDGEEYWR